MIINDTIRHGISYRVHVICVNKFEVTWLASCCTKKPMHAISKTVAYLVFADEFGIT
jgi:hypothetical protein